MIDILLASYNGEKYIGKQIESVINQTNQDWFLYIKDDCSIDSTLDIVLEYERKYKDKIKVIKSDNPSGSAKNNFFSMLQYSENNYIMTCDQDDIWLPDKIELTYDKMKNIEKENPDIPILVHTDLKVVDENLGIINDSLFKMQNIDSNRDQLNHLLVQNIVTGCTVMVNRKLLDYIQRIPKNAIMHDWWMAIIASCFGKIFFIDEPTVLYRQHAQNNVGAKKVNSAEYIINILRNIENIKKSIKNTYLQSGELINILDITKYQDNYDFASEYFLLPNYNKLKRFRILKKYNLWKSGFIRKLGQIIFC
jgi:glycosyltransferase involved in cell wall biosynthesis